MEKLFTLSKVCCFPSNPDRAKLLTRVLHLQIESWSHGQTRLLCVKACLITVSCATRNCALALLCLKIVLVSPFPGYGISGVGPRDGSSSTVTFRWYTSPRTLNLRPSDLLRLP